MKHILFTISVLMLAACGGGSSTNEQAFEGTEIPDGTESFTLHNVRFDSIDYYEGELVTVTEGASFEVQWVSPSSALYTIDLYLSTNDEVHSDRNKIVGLKCGSASFSLCPNATGEVQCGVDDNTLSCSIGSEPFQDENLSNLKFIIKGCDAFDNCDVKSFNFSVQGDTEG